MAKEKDDSEKGEHEEVQQSLVGSENIEKRRILSPVQVQILACTGPLVIMICSGTTSGYSSTLLPSLTKGFIHFPVSKEEASWIASVAALPTAFGSVLMGIIMQRTSRRTSLFVSALPFLVGWITISFSQSVSALITGRLLTGLSCGLVRASVPVYMGEIADPKHRGWILGGITAFSSLGFLIVHMFGTLLSWQVVGALCALFPVIAGILFVLGPETPSWLLENGRIERAEEEFRRLRGSGDAAVYEYRVMVEEQKMKTGMLWKFRDVLRPELWKPLSVTCLLSVTFHASGVYALIFYTVSILNDTLAGKLDEYSCMLIVDVVRFTVSFVACFVQFKVRRKVLTSMSGYGTGMCLIVLSVLLYVLGDLVPSWVLLFLIIGYTVFINIGMAPIVRMIPGEIFPVSARSLTSGISSSVGCLAFFIEVKTAPDLFARVGPQGAFMFYGVSSLIGTLAFHWCLPEIKDKTLQQIEDSYKRKQKKNSVVI